MVIVKGQVDRPDYWALFDLDWTLIRPLKETTFTNNVGWVWLPQRIPILLQLEENGYRIGIITNQKPWPRNNIQSINQRLTEVYTVLRNYLKKEPLILSANDEPEYRKPAIGWMSVLQFQDKTKSFYCGDAAGRSEDFSDSDLQFAQNAGLTFYTPEQFFPITTIPGELYQMPRLFLLLVGAPASGKTTFALQLANQGWIVISSDNYGSSKPRIKSALQKAFSSGSRVVLDATNPTIAGRAEYITLGQQNNFPVCIIHLLNPGDKRNERRPNPVPKIAQRMFWSRLEEPNQTVDHVPVYELL